MVDWIRSVVVGLITMVIWEFLRWLWLKKFIKIDRNILLPVAFIFGFAVGYLIPLFFPPLIDIVKPSKASITYNLKDGYQVYGYFRERKGMMIYITCKKVGGSDTDVWTVLSTADIQESQNKWEGICYLEKITGSIEIGDRYKMRSIMTKKKFDTSNYRYLPRIENSEMDNLTLRTDFFTIQVDGIIPP